MSGIATFTLHVRRYNPYRDRGRSRRRHNRCRGLDRMRLRRHRRRHIRCRGLDRMRLRRLHHLHRGRRCHHVSGCFVRRLGQGSLPPPLSLLQEPRARLPSAQFSSSGCLTSDMKIAYYSLKCIANSLHVLLLITQAFARFIYDLNIIY
jgi:hypothetical protein